VLNQINVASGTRATLIPDVQGSFIGALDATSGTLTKTGYQTYGESGSTGGSFRYTGQRIDPETNGLYYYRARMYARGGASCRSIRLGMREEAISIATSGMIRLI
jgi:hypothetical protein